MPESFWKEGFGMNKDYIRTSVVAGYIDGLLEEKRALGYSYVFEEYLLNVFDHYCNENGLDDPCFSKQFLDGWTKAWGSESPSYHSQSVSFVRQLARYMNSLGVSAYIPVESVKKELAIPHYLNGEERAAFFCALDELQPLVSQPYAWRMWNEYRVIFRLIYSCGMRNSEACQLKGGDVDLTKGTLTVRHSKGDKDRLIYLADDLSELLALYQKYLYDVVGYMPIWFFPSRNLEKPVHKATIDSRFNKVWARTPYASLCGKKPTVHCLRHSFVVDRMNAWNKEGLSYDQMLPYLSKYLGHSGVEESMYYYHLNEEANILICKKDRTAGRVIPGVEKYGA